MKKFIIQTDEAEILLQIEKGISLREIGELLMKDVSVISRRLKALSEKTPFLVKGDQKWILTSAGKRFNEWTKRALLEQESLINEKEKITIAMTREFSNLVFCPSVNDWRQNFSNLNIITTDEGIESLLVKGLADFGFDCGTPYSPQVAFKRGPKEEYALVFNPSLKIKTLDDLKKYSFYFFERLDLADLRNLLGLEFLLPEMTFNDLASLRSSLVHGDGWSVVPKYTVAKELKEGKLKSLPQRVPLSKNSFGLWWNRENPPPEKVRSVAHEWLLKQKL